MLLTLIAISMLGQGFAPGREGMAPLDAAREERVQRLGKQLRCAVCQGLSIADSPASMARAQLDKVRELVAQDQTDQQIFDYFVARYGEWVLLRPNASGTNWLLWLGPGLLLGLGLVFLYSLTKGKSPPVQAAATAATAAPDDPYLAAVRAELKK